jgi:exonuclease SbcD
MKLLHTADWHLGCKVPVLGYDRIQEQATVVNEIVNVVEKENIDVIVIAGDVFDTYLPTIEAEKILNNFIATVSGDLGKDIIIIPGNHDSDEKIRSLSILPHKFSKTKFVTINKSKSIENVVKDGDLVVDFNGISFVCIPFISSFRYLPKSYQGEINYSDFFTRVVGRILDTIDSDVVLVSHDTIVGAEYSSTEVKYDYQNLDIYTISKEDFAPKIRYWALGHIHKCQKLGGNKQGFVIEAWYSGSIIQTDFGEIGDDKCILIVDISDDNVSVNKVPLKHPKKFVFKELYSNEDAEKLLSESDDLLKDNYVKAEIKGEVGTSLIYSLKEKGIIVNSLNYAKSEVTNLLKHVSNILHDPVEVYKSYCKENSYDYTDEEILKLDNFVKKIKESSTL